MVKNLDKTVIDNLNGFITGSGITQAHTHSIAIELPIKQFLAFRVANSAAFQQGFECMISIYSNGHFDGTAAKIKLFFQVALSISTQNTENVSKWLRLFKEIQNSEIFRNFVKIIS
jgi:hypothetical protein